MDSKFPLPTDNIYKFMALFGLVIMITSVSLLIYTQTKANQAVWGNAIAIYDLEAGGDPRKDDKIKILNRQLEIAASDMKTFKWGLSIARAFGDGTQYCSRFMTS